MLAVQVHRPGPPESHGLQDLPDPQPGHGEVLVAIKAAAVNYPDLLVMTGRYQLTPAIPFTSGKEGAGVVCATGPGVTRVRVGDRVLIHVEHGSYATMGIAKQSQCFKLPESMGFVEAATLGLPAQTAWFALHERGGFEPGQSVLVTGASGAVGQAAIQLVSALGGVALAAASNLVRARAALAGIGCRCVDLSVPDLRNSLREQVHEATGGEGVNLVIDTLGADVFDASLRCLAWCGRIVTVGFAAGRIPEVKANYLLVKNISASGLQWSDYRDRTPERVARAHDAMARLWQRGLLKAPDIRVRPLAEFAQALQEVDGRRASGRWVLTME